MMLLTLLPDNRRGAMAATMLRQSWRRALSMLGLVSVIAVGTLGGLNVMLERRAQSLQSTLASMEAADARSQAGNLTKTTNQLNSTIKVFSDIMVNYQPWSSNLGRLITALPTGISVTALKVDATGHFTLEGMASTRTSFLNLQQALTAADWLQNIATTSTASRRDNLPFIYTGTFKAAVS